MTHSTEHQRIHTKMVKQVLKDIAIMKKLPYQVVFRRFIEEDIDCTDWFWDTFYRCFPESNYRYVCYCHDCRHFDLYKTEEDMLGDDTKTSLFFHA
ncbi:hypothetical protein CBG25_16900 [Arsenophonus sp. ENCA]|uniref:hypothetical protein n=1 Tax=Arsenophonus sp. ENCA TaxID=1987579 RepID=UPI000BC754F0|nr:hypothetical protein [Arsenophonus sp. ENCA]PAV01371.1 hypothetical protein CBG25_16900 [Arsenophonus sp. ENCA]